MNKEFVTYEQALSLKELGFDEPCIGWYNPQVNYKKVTTDKYWAFHLTGEWENFKPAPLYQQAFQWFREKYGVFSWLTKHRFNTTTSLGNKEYYRWALEHEVVTSEPHINSEIIYSAKEFETYEEAELACLKKLIEIIKNK